MFVSYLNKKSISSLNSLKNLFKKDNQNFYSSLKYEEPDENLIRLYSEDQNCFYKVGQFMFDNESLKIFHSITKEKMQKKNQL